MAKITRHLQISGRVQGVGFRFYTQRRAQELGVTGWVRNRRDGSVEVMVQGGDDVVDMMVAWLRSGPRGALVNAVRVAEGGGEHAEFVILPTE